MKKTTASVMPGAVELLVIHPERICYRYS